MTDEPIAFTVIGGYLGAGKTTLVNRLLRDPGGRRLAVIVNDFGDVALDEHLIESTDGDVTSLANGCVCCTLSDGFASALEILRELEPRPDHVIVEVSGVGDPWAVAQWGRSPGFALDGIVVVVDPESVRERAADAYVGDTVLAQLRTADLVLSSRADVVDADRMDEVARWVSDHTGAPILIGTDVSLDLLLGRPSVGEAPPHHHADHRAWGFTPCSSDRVALRAWLDAAPDGVVRIKGLVGSEEGLLLGQRVGQRSEVTRSRRDGDPVMTVIATPAADDSAVDAWITDLT